MHKIFTSHSPHETAQLAREMAMSLKPRDVVLLKGDLGCGKSTFARGLIQALCGDQTEVPSPTFTLVQTYETPKFILWHFDLYRLEHPEEIHELGLEDAYGTGVCLIEWPERLGRFLPKNYVEVDFRYGAKEDERYLHFTTCRG